MTNYEFYKKKIDDAIANNRLEDFLEETFNFDCCQLDAYSMMDLFNTLMETYVSGLNVRFVPYEVSTDNDLTVGRIYTVKDGYFNNDTGARFPLCYKLKSVDELKKYLNYGDYDRSKNLVVILEE